jgi:hypothetical protein
MAVDMLNYPGSTFLDMDCESAGYYEGRLPGTVTVSGYSEEYREHQLLVAPLLNLALEGTSVLPVLPLDKIVERIRLLQRQPTLEDNNALREVLGLSQYVKWAAHTTCPHVLSTQQVRVLTIRILLHQQQTKANRKNLHGTNPQFIRRPNPLYRLFKSKTFHYQYSWYRYARHWPPKFPFSDSTRSRVADPAPKGTSDHKLY